MMRVDGENHASNITQIVQTLREQLCELRLTEDNLQSKRQELQQQLEELQRDIDAVHNAVTVKDSQIKEHENSLKVVVALPAEILSLVFLHVTSLAHTIVPTPSPMPLVLSSVCRRWRCVALGDSRLWTHVTLEHAHSYNLEPYLSRSGDSGLDISLVGDFHAPSVTFLRQLQEQAHRWQKLWLDITDAPEHLLPVSTQKRVTSLTHLHLVNRVSPQSAPISPVFALYQNHLRTVTLIHVPFFEKLVAPRLQHLTFVGGWTDECKSDCLWRVLSSASDLRSLRLGLDSISFREPRRTSQLQYLERFALHFDADPSIAALVDLFDMIAAPSLRTIEFIAEERRKSQWDLVPHLKQRYPSVTTLIIYNVISDRKEVQWFIKSFPHIKHLSVDITGLKICARFLGELDQTSHVDCWDKLQTIQVRMPSDLATVDGMDILCDWLERRHNQGFPIPRLDLVMNQTQNGNRRWVWLDALNQWCVTTVVNPSKDEDAPWNFLAKYKGQSGEDECDEPEESSTVSV